MKEDWRIVELGEVCYVKGGKRLPKGHDLLETVTNHKYIRARDIKNGKINFDQPVFVNEKTFESISRYIVNSGELIITIVGANIGDVAYVTDEFHKANLTENAVKLIADNRKTDSLFLKYALVPDYMKYYFQTVASGAAQDKLGLYKIKKVKINLPPLPTQRKIATILSAYDDLIENNLKRIKLLEEKAQLTYEEWFVRLKFPGYETTVIDEETGLPEGWEKVKLSQIAEFLNGYAFKPNDLGERGKPVIKIKEMKNGVVNDTPRNSGDTIPSKYLVENGDILFSWSATLEVVIWKFETGLLNQHLFKVTPKNGYGKSYVFLSNRNSLPIFDGLTTGATMKHIKRKELDFIKLNEPPQNIMDDFEKEVYPTITKVLNFSKQNHLLNEARDILLPRLMTGMIDVEELDVKLEAIR